MIVYILVLIFILFLKYVNLYKIYIEIEKIKIFILMFCVGLGIFFIREIVFEGVKGFWGLFGNFVMKVFIFFGGNRVCCVIFFDLDMDVIVG